MDIGKSIGLTYGQATRNAFGEALRDMGKENKDIVVIDGDVGNSTRTEFFAKQFPGSLLQPGYRREQHGERR